MSFSIFGPFAWLNLNSIAAYLNPPGDHSLLKNSADGTYTQTGLEGVECQPLDPAVLSMLEQSAHLIALQASLLQSSCRQSDIDKISDLAQKTIEECQTKSASATSFWGWFNLSPLLDYFMKLRAPAAEEQSTKLERAPLLELEAKVQSMLSQSAHRITLDQAAYDAIYDPIIAELLEGLDVEKYTEGSLEESKSKIFICNSFIGALQEVVDSPSIVAIDGLNSTDCQLETPPEKLSPFLPPSPPPGPAPLFNLPIPTEQSLIDLKAELQQQIENMQQQEKIGQNDVHFSLKEEILEIERLIERIISKFNDHPIFLQKYMLLLKSIHAELKCNDNLEDSISTLTDSRQFNKDTSSKISLFTKTFKGNIDAQIALLGILKKSIKQLQQISSAKRNDRLAFQLALAAHSEVIKASELLKANHIFEKTKQEWLRLLPSEQFNSPLKISKKAALYGALRMTEAFGSQGRYPLESMEDLEKPLKAFIAFKEAVLQTATSEQLEGLKEEFEFWTTHFVRHLPAGFDRQIL